MKKNYRSVEVLSKVKYVKNILNKEFIMAALGKDD